MVSLLQEIISTGTSVVINVIALLIQSKGFMGSLFQENIFMRNPAFILIKAS